MTAFGLLGAGGQADETADYAHPAVPAFRAVSAQYLVEGRADIIDVDSPTAGESSIAVVAAVGAPGLKRELVETWPGATYRTVVSSLAWLSPSAVVGSGCILAPHSSISSHAVLGDHVLLNIGSSVSHDAVLGDFVTVSPGARIGGRARLGDGVFVGIGAVVSNDVSVAPGIVIGAGAVVVADLLAPGFYVGVPARLLKTQEGWLRAL